MNEDLFYFNKQAHVCSWLLILFYFIFSRKINKMLSVDYLSDWNFQEIKLKFWEVGFVMRLNSLPALDTMGLRGEGSMGKKQGNLRTTKWTIMCKLWTRHLSSTNFESRTSRLQYMKRFKRSFANIFLFNFQI